MKVKGFSFLLLALLSLSSCQDKQETTMPAVVLPEPVMIDVMTDVQLMEGVIGYKRSSGQKSLYLKEVGYDSLFSHHGITDSIFIDNVRYYFESKPATMERILDSVINRISLITDAIDHPPPCEMTTLSLPTS